MEPSLASASSDASSWRAFFQQALNATTTARSKGREVLLVEDALAEGFLLSYGRIVSVQRKGAQVAVSHSPVFPPHREIVAPEVGSYAMVKQAKDVTVRAQLFLLG